MARKIADSLEEAPIEGAQPETEATEGTVFIKNVNPSETLDLGDGQKFSFGKTSITVADEKIIAGLKKLADKPGNPHFIFIQ